MRQYFVKIRYRDDFGRISSCRSCLSARSVANVLDVFLATYCGKDINPVRIIDVRIEEIVNG